MEVEGEAEVNLVEFRNKRMRREDRPHTLGAYQFGVLAKKSKSFSTFPYFLIFFLPKTYQIDDNGILIETL